MSAFLLMSVALCVLVLSLLLPDLWRSQSNASLDIDQEDSNIQFLRSRLDELELQLNTGKLQRTEYEALKLDLESSLAAEISSSSLAPSKSSTTPRSLRALAIVMVFFVPLLTLAIYFWVGTPSMISSTSTAEPEAYDRSEIANMVSQIETRLQEQPDDLEGWRVIARTYLGLGRYAEAERAFLNIIRLEGPTANTYAALADASALANKGQLDGAPIQYIQKALELNPMQPQALWLAGLHAVQTGNNDAGKDYWLTLLPLLDDLPQQQAELRAILSEFDGAPTGSVVSEADSRVIASITVSVDSAFLEKVSPTDTVFVIARVSGSRVPAAVKTLTMADLPSVVEFRASDKMGVGMPNIAAQLAEADATDIQVEARISRSGDAIAQSGDITSEQITLDLTSQNQAKLLINKKL